MSKIKLKEIADAIREKDGTTELIVANDFASRIRALPSGKYNLEVTDEDDGTQSWHLTDWDYIPKPSFDPVFANNSWTKIAEASEIIKANNYTSAQVKEIFGWDLQTDTKVDVGKDGVIRTIHFLGFNHDDLSDGSGKAGIAFGTVDCEPVLYRMYNLASSKGGYPAMPMKTSTLPTIKTLLSDELQGVIKDVNKKSANGGSSYYTETITTSESLFLFSEIEVFGTVTSAQDGINEGTVYEYWNEKADTDRIKKYDSNADGVSETATIWWLRSCSSSNAMKFCEVNLNGGISIANPTGAYGVSFGFCI